MICPYNRKREVQVLQWTQNNENDDIVSLQQIEKTDIAMMDCPKEGCAVWYGGRCHYAAVNLQNE
ncbi:MAG: hypothetical protein ACI3XY_04585 [Butyricicoccaceae bacterium]